MDNEEKITEFETVTGVPKERARFYLESAAWQLDVALASFYENGGDDEDNTHGNELSDPPVQSEQTVSTPTQQTQPASTPKPRTNSRFATVQSLQQSQASSDEEEGQAFYAGGSRNSGQQILGPPKKRDIVADMFKAVQEHATEIDPQNMPSSSSARLFTGTGYRLGQTPEDTTTVATPKTESAPPTTVILKLWREGFTLGDGPMRMYSDPENGEFLDHIKKGEIPPELIQAAHGAEVHLDLEDHRHEQYIPQKSKITAFSGKGHTLGSPAPTFTPSVVLPESTPDVNKGNEQAAVSLLNINESEPSTNIQVRLSDGTRLSGRFNLSHTIADVRRYITTARPQYENASFALMTTFPSRELNNLEETVAQAGLLNAAVLQRLNHVTDGSQTSKRNQHVRFNLENRESYWRSLGNGHNLKDECKHDITLSCKCADFIEMQESYWRNIGKGYTLNASTELEKVVELRPQINESISQENLVERIEAPESYWQTIGRGYVLGRKQEKQGDCSSSLNSKTNNQ